MKRILFLILMSHTIWAQDYSKFATQSINAYGSYQYNNASYFLYARYTENYEDSVITKELVGKSIEAFISKANKSVFGSNKEAVINRILLNSFLSVSNNTTNWEAVKFRTVLGKDTSGYKVMVLKFENHNIQEDKESKTSIILSNLLKLKPEVFSQFEYDKPGNKYSDLAKLSNNMKDVDGTLNIEKLDAYLATKPNELAKYCDF